jgi:hypothetical protein
MNEQFHLWLFENQISLWQEAGISQQLFLVVCYIEFEENPLHDLGADARSQTDVHALHKAFIFTS